MKKILLKKVYRKLALTTSPNFDKYSETANACKRLEILKVRRQDAFKETMKKLTSLLHPDLIYGQDHEKRKKVWN